MKYDRFFALASILAACQSLPQENATETPIFLGFGYIAAEVTQQSVILQTQLTEDI